VSLSGRKKKEEQEEEKTLINGEEEEEQANKHLRKSYQIKKAFNFPNSYRNEHRLS